MTETPPDPTEPPRRARFEPISLSGAARTGRLWLYAAAVVCFVAVAGYMFVIDRQPISSPYVAAPSIGALWFGLRFFMMFGAGK